MLGIYHIFHSDESSCVFLFFVGGISSSSCLATLDNIAQPAPPIKGKVGCTTELRYVTLVLKSTVSLKDFSAQRNAEQFNLALKRTVLLGRTGNAKMSEN